MSENTVYMIENPFLDQDDIMITITWLDYKDGRNYTEVIFESGQEKYILSPLGIPRMHAWDSLETIAAAISFGMALTEESYYNAWDESGNRPDESYWQTIFEYLPSEESELQEYNWTLVY